MPLSVTREWWQPMAFESLVKLLIFLGRRYFTSPYGVFMTAFADDLFSRAAAASGELKRPDRRRMRRAAGNSYGSWFALDRCCPCLALMFLPRQFQVGVVVENVNDESHLQVAPIWLFPLYLLLINLFVLPIAAGRADAISLPVGTWMPDTFVLTLADRPSAPMVGWSLLAVHRWAIGRRLVW